MWLEMCANNVLIPSWQQYPHYRRLFSRNNAKPRLSENINTAALRKMMYGRMEWRVSVMALKNVEVENRTVHKEERSGIKKIHKFLHATDSSAAGRM
jgi:hypothetical protein